LKPAGKVQVVVTTHEHRLHQPGRGSCPR
jgi:hypothetical protein